MFFYQTSSKGYLTDPTIWLFFQVFPRVGRQQCLSVGFCAREPEGRP